VACRYYAQHALPRPNIAQRATHSYRYVLAIEERETVCVRSEWTRGRLSNSSDAAAGVFAQALRNCPRS